MQEAGVVAVVLAAVVIWGGIAGRLERNELTAPIAFVALGIVLHAAGLFDPSELPDLAGQIRLLAELTLVLVLFSDASRVRFADIRDDIGLYVRLLAIGLPLTILLGLWLASALLPGSDIWLLVLVAAGLAPTDAALGAPLMTSRWVPSRIRRALNVESGLNDGIVTPIVSAAIAGVAVAEDLTGSRGVGAAVLALIRGLLAGLVVGGAGGVLIRVARRRGWIDPEFGGPTLLALALLAYVGALVIDGNGFVAAFVAGLAFRNTRGPRTAREVEYVEQSGAALSIIVWLLVGAVILPVMADNLNWRVAIYAVLSLTVVRMVPVAIALIGSGLSRATVAFIGWFGPRGLASVIFALLAVEELGQGADAAVAVMGFTVLLSVIAHGVTAAPLAARYGAATVSARLPESGRQSEIPVRRISLGRHLDRATTTDG